MWLEGERTIKRRARSSDLRRQSESSESGHSSLFVTNRKSTHKKHYSELGRTEMSTCASELAAP